MARQNYEATAKALSADLAREREVKLANYFLAHPQLTEEMREAIRQKWFTLGMTREDVEFSMGKPRRTVRSGGVGGEWETWYYHSVSIDFIGDVVARWVVFQGF